MVSNWNEEATIQRGIPEEKLVTCMLFFGLLLYVLFYDIVIILDECRKVREYLENLHTHLKTM